jgi:hypothetical protein
VRFGSVNDAVFELARRARELANLRMPELRRAAEYEGVDVGRGTRGELIEVVLVEEYLEDFPKEVLND